MLVVLLDVLCCVVLVLVVGVCFDDCVCGMIDFGVFILCLIVAAFIYFTWCICLL